MRSSRLLRVFTVFIRIILALAFLPSGVTKLLGNRFTMLGLDNPVGFFFEALYRTGFYWRFLGICQLLAALLLVIPRTATIGALVYFPLILNIFVITVSMHFQGTPIITGLMLLADLYLLCWDYDKLKHLMKRS
ncbi:MAG TPA: DoxX family membrane protein [Pyrinomonadaceae bacterium]|nr:DoxX family membrane protein [Pyrinomonadaceae bacterium]